MAKFLHFLSFVVLLPLLSHSSRVLGPKTPSPSQSELTRYGFPIGLLPSNVSNYNINQTSGEFYVDIGDACRVTLPPDNYLATYSKKITGKIVQGRIADLNGIRVRAFFQWWSITGIRSSGDNLVFEVGWFRQSIRLRTLLRARIARAAILLHERVSGGCFHWSNDLIKSAQMEESP